MPARNTTLNKIEPGPNSKQKQATIDSAIIPALTSLGFRLAPAMLYQITGPNRKSEILWIKYRTDKLTEARPFICSNKTLSDILNLVTQTEGEFV